MAIMCFLVMLANNNGMFYIVFMYTCRQYWDNSSVSLTDVFQEKKNVFMYFFLIKQVEKSQQNWGKMMNGYRCYFKDSIGVVISKSIILLRAEL